MQKVQMVSYFSGGIPIPLACEKSYRTVALCGVNPIDKNGGGESDLFHSRQSIRWLLRGMGARKQLQEVANLVL
jgi:hypothetical protein